MWWVKEMGKQKSEVPRKILFQEVLVRIYFLGSKAGNVSRVTSARKDRPIKTKSSALVLEKGFKELKSV